MNSFNQRLSKYRLPKAMRNIKDHEINQSV